MKMFSVNNFLQRIGGSLSVLHGRLKPILKERFDQLRRVATSVRERTDQSPSVRSIRKRWKPILIIIGTLLAFYLVYFVLRQYPSFGICSTTLPQHTSSISPCRLLRSWSLSQQQSDFQIKKPTKSMPFARLNKNIPGLLLLYVEKPFLGENAFGWIRQALYSKKVTKYYKEVTTGFSSLMHLFDYKFVEKVFQYSSNAELKGKCMLPSLHEPFSQARETWISDEVFAQQRLAGISPLSLKRITFSDEIGVNWDELKKTLNYTFDWNIAVMNSLKGKSLEMAINDGQLYVLYHPLSNDLQTTDQKRSQREKKVRDFLSPIAIFASVSGKYWGLKARLMPIAIQMDYKPEAEVYTPSDGKQWRFAKLNVQLTDLETNQIVEHLSKTHLVTEGLCLSIERQLSEYHPLYAIMRYHCRGIFVANTVGGPVLLEPNKELDQLFPYGANGANELVKRSWESYHWNDLDFKKDILKRGVDDHLRLPYYPYRDDGVHIENAIKLMVSDYLRLYYPTNETVLQDHELQSFANEASDNGTLPHGSQGQIRGFPSSISSREQLIEIVTQMIWLMTARHVVTNYPLSDYAAYVPNMPVKLYDHNKLHLKHILPDRNLTVVQVAFVMTLASYRYDRLFDYYKYLNDPTAAELVYDHFRRLYQDVEPLLSKRNKHRYDMGYLTFPYMQPSWIPNGIQT